MLVRLLSGTTCNDTHEALVPKSLIWISFLIILQGYAIMRKAIQYSTVPTYSLKLVKERAVRYPVEKVQHADAVALVMRAYLQDRDCEHMAALLLDGANRMIGIHMVAQGGIAGCHTTARDCLKHCIVGRASSWVCSHNHPSSDLTPSQEDIIFTKKLKEASEIIGIPLLDHVIVSSGINEGSYSFLEHGIF